MDIPTVQQHIQSLDIDGLAALWVQIKDSQKSLADELGEIEAEIVTRLGSREEGAQTHSTEAGAKITVTGKLIYKADIPALLAFADRLPEHLRPIKTETKLDDAGAKYLRANEPDLWRLIAPAIEIKPAKTSISIKKE